MKIILAMTAGAVIVVAVWFLALVWLFTVDPRSETIVESPTYIGVDSQQTA